LRRVARPKRLARTRREGLHARAMTEIGSPAILIPEKARELDADLIISFIGWLIGPFQDALLVEELDPGLFRHPGVSPEKKSERIDQFVDLMRRAIGAQPEP